MVLHGDEHPAAGRAPGHRGGHRARPRASWQLRVAAGGAAAAGRRTTSSCVGTRSRPGSTPKLCRFSMGRPGSSPPAAASLALHEPRDLPRRPGRLGDRRGLRGSDRNTTRCWSKIVAHGTDRAEALCTVSTPRCAGRCCWGSARNGVPRGAARRPRRARRGTSTPVWSPRRAGELAKADLPDDVVGSRHRGSRCSTWSPAASVVDPFDIPGGWRVGEHAWTTRRVVACWPRPGRGPPRGPRRLGRADHRPRRAAARVHHRRPPAHPERDHPRLRRRLERRRGAVGVAGRPQLGSSASRRP